MRLRYQSRYLVLMTSLLLTLAPTLLSPPAAEAAVGTCAFPPYGGNPFLPHPTDWRKTYPYTVTARVTRVDKLAGLDSTVEFQVYTSFLCGRWNRIGEATGNHLRPDWRGSSLVPAHWVVGGPFPISIRAEDNDWPDSDDHADINPATRAYNNPGRNPYDINLTVLLFRQDAAQALGYYQLGSVLEVHTGWQYALTEISWGRWSTGRISLGGGTAPDRASIEFEIIVASNFR